MSKDKRVITALVVLCLLLISHQAWCQHQDHGDYDNTTAGRKPILSTEDPISTATGEYYFYKTLFELGGPLPLDYQLYYGSQFTQQTTANRLPLRFDGNHTPLLYAMDDSEDPTIRRAAISLGRGEEILASKVPPDTEWQVSTVKATPYKLKETTEYFYLLDPSKDLVYTFRKATPSGDLQYAYAVRIEDRNGNALTYDNPANISSTGPTGVYDGLGRELKFTYNAYQYPSTPGSPTVYQRYYLDRIEDQAGRVWTLTYEADENERNYTSDPPYVIRSITDPMGNETRFTYGGLKRITNIIKPKGNVPFANTYNASYDTGVVQTQADGDGNIMTLTLNLFDLATSTETRFGVSYPDGTSRVFDHTHSGRVMKGLTDAAGKSATFQSDSVKDRVTGVIDRLGDTTSFAYHPETGRLSSITNAEGKTLSYTYAPQDQTFQNPINGEEVVFTFYNRTRTDFPDGTNEQFTYDLKGNRLTRVDRAGKTWTYTYNGRGQVLTETNPTGGVITNSYKPDATLASSTDSETEATTYGYDDYKRLNKLTHPDGAFLQMTYDLNNRLTSITDENNQRYTYGYDKNGNLTTVTDPKGNQTQYAYDLMDRVTRITDRLNKTSLIAYDNMGRISSVTDPNSIATSFGYDSRGWQNSTAVGGQIWQTGHDDEGVASSATTPLGQTTIFRTNKLGYVTGITDPLNKTTSLTRDLMNRITGITDPLNRTTTYGYDGRGLLSSVTTPDSGVATYTRNGLGLLNQITDLNGQNWTLGYTNMGRPSSVVDPLGNSTGFSYDTRGRLSQTAYADSSTMARTYDNAGNVTKRLYSDGTDLRYTYDELNRLLEANNIALTRDAEGRITSTGNAGTAFGAAYDGGGRIATVTYNNGFFTVTYTYDAASGLLSRVTDNLTGARMDFTYDNDRRLSGLSRSNGVNTTYTYDNAGRITRIQDGTIIDVQYSLNAAGEIASVNMTVPLDPATLLTNGTNTFAYDSASQISAAGYAYDRRGRLTASPGNTFTWDGASRLIGAGGATMAYNGVGDLVVRTSGGAAIHFYYNKAIGLSPIAAEKNDSSGSFLRYYVWTPGGSLLYMIDAADGNKVYFYHFDRTGSTLALTDSSGAVSDSYAYTPYGELLGHNGANPQPFTFIGKWGVRQEGDSGLYHMRARYYDAMTQRFISREPFWPMMTNPKTINPYQYAAGNPVSYIDPGGLWVGRAIKWAAKKILGEVAKEMLLPDYADMAESRSGDGLEFAAFFLYSSLNPDEVLEYAAGEYWAERAGAAYDAELERELSSQREERRRQKEEEWEVQSQAMQWIAQEEARKKVAELEARMNKGAIEAPKTVRTRTEVPITVSFIDLFNANYDATTHVGAREAPNKTNWQDLYIKDRMREADWKELRESFENPWLELFSDPSFWQWGASAQYRANKEAFK
jgi:RHS repeat-associated protein